LFYFQYKKYHLFISPERADKEVEPLFLKVLVCQSSLTYTSTLLLPTVELYVYRVRSQPPRQARSKPRPEMKNPPTRRAFHSIFFKSGNSCRAETVLRTAHEHTLSPVSASQDLRSNDTRRT